MTTETTTPAPTTIDISVERPNEQALARGATAVLALVNDFEVTDDPTFELAADELRSIKAKAASLDDRRKSITKPMDDAKKAVMDLFRGPIELLTQAEGILKGKMLTYQQDQRRKAEEARLRAERIAHEQRAQLEAEARALAEAGRTGEAAVKEQVASMVVAAPAAAPAAPTAKGVSTRETIDHELDDLAKLVAFIATGSGDTPLARPDLIGLLIADGAKLRAYVRGLGLQCNLPGVRVFSKATLSASRRG